MLILAFAFVPVMTLTGSVAADSKSQALGGVCETGSDCSGSGVTNAVSVAVNILSLIVGIAAVVMIILGGLKYVTSGGDSNKVANAKGTITYALIGLVIAVLAQAIVHYVLTVASNQCPSDTSIAANDPRCQVTK